MSTLKGITATFKREGIVMTQSVYTKEQFDNLFEAVLNLDHKVRELESDIYNMRRDNDELRRRVSDLESKKRMPPF